MSVENFAPLPYRRRRFRLWPWIILGIVAGIIVLGVVVGVAVFSALNSLKHTGPIPARYYLYMIDQNYAQAYTYLDSNATINGQQVDQQSFTNLATAADARYGKVTGFDLENGGDSTHMTVTVQRSNRHYVVHLQLKQEGSDLKIISADGL